MKIKKYVFPLAVGILTFALGVSVYTGARIATSLLSSIVWNEEVVVQAVVGDAPAAAPQIDAKAPEPIVVGIEESNPEVSQVEPEYEFDGTGEYWLIDDSLPKGFEDLEGLEIVMRDYDVDANDHPSGIPIPPKGSLQTKETFNFKRIAIGAKEITFQTEEVNGISYKFTGRFLDEEHIEGDEFPSDLAGRLIKFKNGVWIASMHAKFYTSHC